jgi:hypothetical protein
MSIEFEEPQNDPINYRTVEVNFDHTSKPPSIVRAVMKLGIKNEKYANYILVFLTLVFFAVSAMVAYTFLFAGRPSQSRQTTLPVEMYPLPKAIINVPESRP